MITRFVVRPDNTNKLLLIGADGPLKPGIVYELVELMGETIIRPIGPSCATEKDWNQSVVGLVENHHRPVLLTDQEYECLKELK